MGRAKLNPEVADLLLELVNVSTAMIGEVSRGEEGSGSRGSDRQADALEVRLKTIGSGGDSRVEESILWIPWGWRRRFERSSRSTRSTDSGRTCAKAWES